MSNLNQMSENTTYGVLTRDAQGEELYRSQYDSWDDANEVKEMYEANTVRTDNGQTHHIMIERDKEKNTLPN